VDFLAFFDVAGLVFCLSLACSVFGLTICRILRWRWILQQGLGLNAVIGLAAALVFLEVWNFLFPVNHASVCVLFIHTGIGNIASANID
jgi:hypothetical protein